MPAMVGRGGIWAVILGTAVMAVLLWLGGREDVVRAGEMPAEAGVAKLDAWAVGGDSPGPAEVGVAAARQGQENPNQAADEEGGDNRVAVEIYTAVTAAGVVVVGLLGYLLRRRLGLIKPPPDPEDVHS